jgi:hypothetical protein
VIFWLQAHRCCGWVQKIRDWMINFWTSWSCVLARVWAWRGSWAWTTGWLTCWGATACLKARTAV